MPISDEALKNFNDSKFNFYDETVGKDADLSNLDDSHKYAFRVEKTVVQDQMPVKAVVNTINNEFGKTTNV